MTTHVRPGSPLFIPGTATKTTLCDNPGLSIHRLATTVKGRWEPPISIGVCVCMCVCPSQTQLSLFSAWVLKAKGNY